MVDSGAGAVTTFDLNTWQETEESLELQKGLALDQPLFEGYAGRSATTHCCCWHAARRGLA